MKQKLNAHSISNWHDINWLYCQNQVMHHQNEIIVAFNENNIGKVKQLQQNLCNSFAARAISVRTVTTNQGKKTAGIDKQVWLTPFNKWKNVHEIKNIQNYKAKAVRRVWISKDGKPVKPNKMNGRPLGIPTMHDRAIQTLYNLALAPIAECTGDRHSFGFRRYRSCKDAIAMLHIRLSNRHRPEWILEADIKGFFNNISHEWIVYNIPLEKEKLKQWLKAPHIEKTTFHQASAGVPQGGTISPTISNMVLDKLSNHIEKAVKPYTTKKGNTYTKYNTKVTMIRYAYDFVVTGSTKEILVYVIKPAIRDFLAIRGLNLNETKTKITFIIQGFDFLGFNIRLYKDVKRKPTEKNFTY